MKKLFKEVDPVTENETIDEAVVETTEETPVALVEEEVVEIKPVKKAAGVTVTVPSLNLRASASTTAPVVRVLPINTKLNVKGETGDFFEVEGPDGIHGFCKKQFVS